VLFGYFVPTPRLPKGRYVVWCTDGEEGNTKDPRRDNILYDGSWPYPFNELPLVKFPGISVPGALYDDAIVTAAVPLQKVINRTHSQIIEYKNITLRPQVWAPYGSVKEKVTNEPGAINQFQPVMGMRPEVQQPQPIPNYVFQMLEEAKMGLKELFGLTEVSEGSVPPNVEAGVAIDLLQEMSADRIAPQMRHIETALARAGKYMLTLAQKYYTEERTLRIHGSGGTSQVKKFKGADIASGIDVIAESGSGLPRTRAGRQARIDAFVDRGVIQPHQAWKYYDLADMRSVAKKYAADEDQAFREHEKINNGEPINAVAFEAAMQSVQQGINPDTGEAFTDPAEVEAVLQRAGLQPGPAENYAAHLDIHHDQIVSVEFEGLPTEVQKAYLLHYELTQAASKETAPIPEGQSPRVSLSMHGTLGPTVASKIMQQAGVDASPEEFLEQPLETLVMDSVDAPDRDEAANDPFTEEEKLNDMQIRADEHAVAMTKSAQDLAHAERKMQLTEETERAKAKAAAQRPSRPSGN
jgi:hypothetical protein